MVLQVVKPALIALPHITYTQVSASEGDVYSQAGAHGGHVEWMGKDCVLVIMAEDKCLVVALSVVGREGHTYHWRRQLPTQDDVTTGDVKAI